MDLRGYGIVVASAFLLMTRLAGAQAPSTDTTKIPASLPSSSSSSSSGDAKSSSPGDDVDAVDAAAAQGFSPDRLRELMNRPEPILQTLEQKPTFRIRIEERRRFLELMRNPNKEKVDRRPPPPGGLYGYEQQRMALAAIDNHGTRMEPYAAFSGSEMVALAFEGLVRKYVVGSALNAIADANQKRSQSSAREEVDRQIRAYCAAQPDYGVSTRICAERGVR